MGYGGTREWAKHTDNCLLGCSHDCLYCYARHNACVRFKTMPRNQWSHPQVDDKRLNKKRGRKHGGVMFPTAHDILPKFLDSCMEVIEQHLKAGNRLLIVSKPHLYCIDAITRMSCREPILFRFSIGAVSDDVLSFWEPGAPCFKERLACLRVAQARGYRTSVSAEPLLDPTVEAATKLFDELGPYVTDTIWVGKLNRGPQRLPKHVIRSYPWDLVSAGQTDERVRGIYEALKGHPKARWKESYRKVVGLALADAPEMEASS